MIITTKKYTDNSWDFRTANTKQFTHCFHGYPAMMIPQVAARIIDEIAPSANRLFDPYCGTGTSLVEAKLRGIEAFGIDLNPLARLIAQAKTTPLSLQILDLYLKEYVNYSFAARFDIYTVNVVTPNFPNKDFWFREREQHDLAIIKRFIDNIQEPDIAQFFRIAFSETVRESSLTKKSEFKLVRMSEEQIAKFEPDVFGIMESKLSRNRNGLKEFIKALEHKHLSHIHICNTDTAHSLPHDIEPESIDIVVTSPPYGDSRTTVAYGQFSRLANQWLGVEDASQVDNQLMGGKKLLQTKRFDIPILDETIERIAAIDERRAMEVASFYQDYARSIHNVAQTLVRGGYACYVVGNRRVKGIQLPTDEITRALFEQANFIHHSTIIRSIPNKRMPSKNSPSNVPGMTDETMSNEYIVILQKH